MDNKARARYAEAYRGSAHGKAKRKAYDQSEAGKLSQKLRNQRRRDKLLATRAAEQKRIRDAEIYLDGVLIGHIVNGVTIPLPIKDKTDDEII